MAIIVKSERTICPKRLDTKLPFFELVTPGSRANLLKSQIICYTSFPTCTWILMTLGFLTINSKNPARHNALQLLLIEQLNNLHVILLIT